MDRIFHTGGPLSNETPCYIERRSDQEALRETTLGNYLTIIAPRQMGKTSLMKRLMEEANQLGWKSCIIDFSPMKGLNKLEWFSYLGDEIGRQMKIMPRTKLRNQLDFKSYLLNQLGVANNEAPARIALFFDEIEALSAHPFSDEFLMVLRALYNERDGYAGSILAVFAGSVDQKSLVKDPTISPFNVSHEIKLTHFTEDQTLKLTNLLSDLNIAVADEVHNCIYSWTSGQPHLTQRICEIIESNVQLDGVTEISSVDIEQIIKNQMLNPQNRDLNVKHVLSEINRLPQQTKSLLNSVLSDKSTSAHTPGFYSLYLTGAVTATSDDQVEISNRIYSNAIQMSREREPHNSQDSLQEDILQPKSGALSTSEKELSPPYINRQKWLRSDKIAVVSIIVVIAMGIIATYFKPELWTDREDAYSNWVGKWRHTEQIVGGTFTGNMELKILLQGEQKTLVGNCDNKQDGITELKGNLSNDGQTFTGTWTNLVTKQAGTFKLMLKSGNHFEGNYVMDGKFLDEAANKWVGLKQ